MTTVNTPVSDLPTRRQSRAVSAGRISLWASVASVALLLILHVTRSDVSVEWQTTSEYARGPAGWLGVIAVLLSALGLFALTIAAASVTRTAPGRIGLVVLSIVAICTFFGGVFIADPIETAQSELSLSGTIHGMTAGLALMLTPIAAAFLSISLARKTESRGARVALVVTAVVPLVALFAFMAVQSVILPADGHFGPEVPIGPIERALVVAYAVWQLVTAAILANSRSWR